MPAKGRRKAAPPKRKPARTRVTFTDPYIRVKDVKRSADWYKRLLGFETGMAMPNKSKPTFVRLIAPGGAAIMIGDGGDAMSGKKPAATVRKAISARNAQRVVSLYLRVDSGINALYESTRKRAKVVQPLTTQPYGMREFALRDPDGYEVGIGMEVAVPAAPPAPKKAAPKKKAVAKKKAPAKKKSAKKASSKK